MKKKVAPALAVILLIVVVVGIGFLTRLIQKYTPSSEVMDSQEYFGLDSDDEAAIVIGSEGEGIHRLTKDLCDDTLTIPQYGKVNSLNASVAAGIVLYEAVRQRKQ